MRRRNRWLPLAFALALPAVAADAQESEAARRAQAPPPDAPAGPPEQPRRGGLFAIVVEWFQGGAEEENPPAPGSALAAVAEPESMAEPEPAVESEPDAATELVPEQAWERQRGHGGEAVTLAEVHRAARDLVAEIEVLRRAQGVTGEPAPVEPGDGDEAPVHAWLESLEVMEKAARVQRRFGMIPFEVASMPAGNITLEHTYGNVLTVIEELRRVKRQLVIEARIEPAPLDADEPAPALVEARLAGASARLDALVGRPVSSNDVYMHVLRVRGAMQPLAAALGVALERDPPGEDTANETKSPKEIAQQLLIATYKVVNLQSRLGMAPSNTPDASLGDVAPADVYEATNRLLVELARIRAHLDIESPPPERHETRRMQPGDVFAQVRRLIADLDRMSKAVAGAG